MRLTHISLQNFRCFGPERTIIELDPFTGLIGANGAGKTAVLMALARMFGTTAPLRDLQVDDFHLPEGESLGNAEERTMAIEVRLDFPELVEAGKDRSAVPPSFKAMVVDAPKEPPYCRIRLMAKWTNTELDAGEIESRLVWVASPDEEPGTDHLKAVSPLDRARIQVFYVPGSRDASRQLANASGTLLNQLLKAVKWTEGIKAEIQEKAELVRQAFVTLAPVTLINSTSALYWQDLYDDRPYANPSLAFMGSEFDDVLKDTRMVFNPTHGESNQPLERLSDGQQSLFYFAFINTLFSIRRQVYDDHHRPSVEDDAVPNDAEVSPAGRITDYISFEKLRPAPLTIFAIEEPENHLAPHYLARIIGQLSKIAEHDGAQVFVSSHCPGIVARISPEHIRHFSLRPGMMQSVVRSVTLPPEADRAFKYVKQAVQAYPELYFSRLVVLGEGDSEEHLLKRFALLAGTPLDTAFVSVVPLGGRFVSHLWRLLSDLEIPHLTLLDLDQERATGGWHTVRYVLSELKAVLSLEKQQELFLLSDGTQLSEAGLDEMGNWDIADVDLLDGWIQCLERYGVFLSRPLDIDFLMLTAFPPRYQNVYEGKPYGMGPDKIAGRIAAAVPAVLGSDGGDGSSFDDSERALFPWYSYLFLGKGKPTTHALAWLDDDSFKTSDLPAPLDRLFSRIAELTKTPGTV